MRFDSDVFIFASATATLIKPWFFARLVQQVVSAIVARLVEMLLVLYDVAIAVVPLIYYRFQFHLASAYECSHSSLLNT